MNRTWMSIALAIALAGLAIGGELTFERHQLTAEQAAGQDKKVQELVDDLGADNADVRDRAEFRIEDLPPIDYPRLEAIYSKGDIGAETKIRLGRVMPRLKAAAERAAKKSDADFANDVAVADSCWAHYVKTGPVDPKWDADVRIALTHWAYGDLYDTPAQTSAAARDAAKAAEAALAAGCADDDLRAIQVIVSHAAHPFARETDTAMAAVDAEHPKMDLTPDLRAYWIASRLRRYLLAHPDWKTDHSAEYETFKADAVEARLAAIAVPGIPPVARSENAQQFMTNYAIYYDPENLILQFEDALQKVMPNDPAISEFKALEYYATARTALDAKDHNALNQDDWNLYFKRMRVSATAAEAAWKRDPSRFGPVITRLRAAVALDEGSDVARVWFERGKAIDPDFYDLYMNMMFSLLPAHGGTEEGALAFGRQCVADGDWHSRAPMTLVMAHLNIDHASTPDRHHFLEPGVWDETRDALNEYLRRDTGDVHFRSACALCAYRAGDYATAADMFKKLGNRVDVAIFDSPTAMALARRESAKKAAE